MLVVAKLVDATGIRNVLGTGAYACSNCSVGEGYLFRNPTSRFESWLSNEWRNRYCQHLTNWRINKWTL